MRMTRRSPWLFSLSLGLLVASVTGAQQTAGSDPDVIEGSGPSVPTTVSREPARDWHFYIAPYGWLAGTAGHIYIDGERTDLDASFSDLSSRTRAGFQVYFEARHGKWFLAFDGTWATLGDEIEGVITTTDIEVEQRIYDIRSGYEA